jgi:formylglycine-generating enzyme required for sulfatase activity
MDQDGDGYGRGDNCQDNDCDDNDPAVHPGAIEVCDDGQDNDCDGKTDQKSGFCQTPPETMVFVGPGWFWRGSCSDQEEKNQCMVDSPGYSAAGEYNEDEFPLRQIMLKGFFIDRYEVTVAEFKACIKAGVCKIDHFDPSCNLAEPMRDLYPVNCVSWVGADEYCQYRGKRLPTEAEWEKAARGPNGQKYAWGNNDPTCEQANFDNDYWDSEVSCVGDTTPVDRYPESCSLYGACDMAGNVAEWVNDWYEMKYYQYSPSENPEGPQFNLGSPFKITYRSVRGGSWGSDNRRIRTASRAFLAPEEYLPSLGFRCAKDE